jgi:hypothetical protein
MRRLNALKTYDGLELNASESSASRTDLFTPKGTASVPFGYERDGPVENSHPSRSLNTILTELSRIR